MGENKCRFYLDKLRKMLHTITILNLIEYNTIDNVFMVESITSLTRQPCHSSKCESSLFWS